MASGSYQNGAMQIHNGTIDCDTTTLKAMLIGTGYTFDPDQTTVSGAGGLGANELSGVTNYTGGHGGSGRKTITVTLQVNNTNNRLEILIGSLTWTALGGASNGTIGGVAVEKPGTSDDTTAIPVWYWDVTDTPTNGGDITVNFGALTNGAVQVNCG